jgi:hypothetical protein
MQKRLALGLAGAALLAAGIIAWPKIAARATHPATAAQNQIDLTQYVFATGGCSDCHTVSSNGTLGFNDKGKRMGQDFEGCSRMLAAMNLIAQVDFDQRSPQQRQIASRFDEFGCGFCHRITPGKVGLTAAGAKLGNLHLKCVAIDSCCRRPG